MSQNLPTVIPDYLREFYANSDIDVGQFTSGINAGRGPHISTEGGTTFNLVTADGLSKPPMNMGGQMLFDHKRGPFIDVAVLASSPGVLKRYYERGYVKGDALPPDCFSNDGRVPDPSASRPQNAICSGCKWDAFGTARGESEGKACSDRKRLAVLYLWDLQGPIYEYEVSPSNLKKWQAYAFNVAGRVPGGVMSVITRIYFEPGVQGGVLYEVAPAPNAQAGHPYPEGTGWWFVGPKIMPLLATARNSEECRRAAAKPMLPLLSGPAQSQTYGQLQHTERAQGYADAPAAPLAHQPQPQIESRQPQPQQQQSDQPQAEQAKRTRRTRAQIEAEAAALAAAHQGVTQQQQPDTDQFGVGDVSGAANGQTAQRQQPQADPMDDIPGFQGNVQFGVATRVPQTDAATDAALAGMM